MKIVEEWERLEGVAGKETTDALRKLYSLYTDDIVDWFASLYDAGTGGYYASRSGRDGVFYGPDVQCTMQSLYFIIRSGLTKHISDDPRDFLPEDMQHRLIYFAKSIQSPDNGHFYQPQWGREATDSKLSRRGRDLSWATDILSVLGSAPTYDAPNGVKGDGITADEYWDSLGTDLPRPYTYDRAPYVIEFIDGYDGGKLGDSYRSFMEKAIATAPKEAKSKAGDTTSYMRSHTAFIAYLLDRAEPEFHTNPYRMGNELGSTMSELGRVSLSLGKYRYSDSDGERCRRFDGMTLVEMALSVLESAVNPETGIWGDLTERNPRGYEFCYINGFFKTLGIFTSSGVAYPAKYVPLAAEAIMKCLMSDEPSTTNVCDLYNVWACVGFLRKNMELLTDVALRAQVTDRVRAILKENAPAAILNTYEKLKGYKKSDGGFAHDYRHGTSVHQSLPVATGENQSDVDGTCIATTGLTRALFDALELSEYKPSMFSADDYERYLSAIDGYHPKVKIKYILK